MPRKERAEVGPGEPRVTSAGESVTNGLARRGQFAEAAVYGTTVTGRPAQARVSNVRASQLARRKQPIYSVRPTCSGVGVPWIP